jgi:phosphoribosyl 1,2-cyclic phosphodiesterase
VILGSCEFVDFSPNDTLDLGDGITVVTAPLNHPNGACGYRVEYKGHAIAIVTDTEHYEGKVDENVLKLAKDADIMVYDSAYTDEEYPKFKGWGHSTWQEALKVAEAANVTKTVLFHHDPSHDDNYMDEIAEISGAARFGTEPAREGMVIKVNI